MTNYRYEIDPRSPALGGGWRLRLIEDGEEVGGAIFPLCEYEFAENPEEADKMAYTAAQTEGLDWLESRTRQLP